MALNLPGPYVLRLKYSVNGSPGGVLEHEAQYNIDLDTDPDVGEDFANINAVRDGYSTRTLKSWCDDWLGIIDWLFNDDATSFIEYTLWKSVAASFEVDFRASYTPSHTWDVVTGVREASQVNFSFRSAEGGIMFINLLDTIADPDVPVGYSQMAADYQALADFVLNPAENILLARDTSYPTSVIKAQTSQNDAIFNARYRP